MTILLTDKQITIAHFTEEVPYCDIVNFDTVQCMGEFLETLSVVRVKDVDGREARKLLRSMVSSYCRPALIVCNERRLDSLPLSMCEELLAWQDVTDLRTIRRCP